MQVLPKGISRYQKKKEILLVGNVRAYKGILKKPSILKSGKNYKLEFIFVRIC